MEKRIGKPAPPHMESSYSLCIHCSRSCDPTRPCKTQQNTERDWRHYRTQWDTTWIRKMTWIPNLPTKAMILCLNQSLAQVNGMKMSTINVAWRILWPEASHVFLLPFFDFLLKNPIKEPVHTKVPLSLYYYKYFLDVQRSWRKWAVWKRSSCDMCI